MSERLNSDSGSGEKATEWDSLSEFRFDPQKSSQYKITDAGNTFGEGRDDRHVASAEPGNELQKSSSILIGKTGKGENFQNGTYYSLEDSMEQFSKQLDETPNSQVVDISVEPPTPVTIDEMKAGISEGAKKGQDAIRIAGTRVNNTNAKILEVVDSEGDTLAKSIQFNKAENNPTDGEYLPEGAFRDALNRYRIGVEEPVKSVAVKSPTEFSFKLSKKIAVAAMSVLLLLSFGGSENSNASTNTAVNDTFGNIAELVVEDGQVATPEEADGIQIGDKYYADDGIDVHRSSDYEHGGEDGKIAAESGVYDIQGFSVQDPVTHEINEVTWKDGDDLDEFIELEAKRLSEKYGREISADELKSGAKIHVGKNGDPEQSQLGWVDYGDIVNNN